MNRSVSRAFPLIVLAGLLAVGLCCAGPYEAPKTVRGAGEAEFTVKPQARRAGKGVEITFAVSAATDVEVAIVDADGNVVRHIAAGLLGENAPAPFQKGALKQTLRWDGKDDAGKPVAGSSRVRVRLGVGAKFNRFIPKQVSPPGPVSGLGVGPDGTVYVLASRGKSGGAFLYALDREGTYLRTILPSPPGLKPEDVAGLDRLKLGDGSFVPIVYNAYMADVAPYLAGFRAQQLAVSKENWIVMASGGNNWSDQSVPRHALVIKADGTTPADIGFVGPKLAPHSRYSIGLRPQQLALSPDGKTVYFAGLGNAGYKKKRPPKSIHTIGRFTWESGKGPEPFLGNPDEPGDGPDQLNNPVSVATDAKGALYVVDAGNKRIAAFDPDGKPLGQTTADRPRMVCVAADGSMFVLTAPNLKKSKWGPFALVKYDKAIGGTEVARTGFHGRGGVVALDPGAERPRLWVGFEPGWRKPAQLIPVTDEGDKLVVGKNVLGSGGGGFTSPLYIEADPAHNRLYVGDFVQKVKKVDLATDRISSFLKASEVTVDRHGNVYALMGYGGNALDRFTPEGKPLPFEATGKNRITVPYRAGGPHVGVRGLTIAPNGDLYVYEEKGKPEQLHVFGPDGRMKATGILKDIPPDSANGIAVDRAGNIYAGICVHTPDHLYPAEFRDQIPPLAWYMLYTLKSGWYRAAPQRGIPDAPWKHMYLNFYLYHYGSVFKFTPKGGRFWTGVAPKGKGPQPRPEGVPPDAAEYRHGYFRKLAWCDGAEWRYRGFGINVNRTESWGDPACSCFTSRFEIDAYDRLFVPDIFRFQVIVLDTAGNEITRIGAYGNEDCGGPGSAVPSPAIPLCSPNAVAPCDDRVYIADRKSRRIVVADLVYQAEATCKVP